jgi:hypothetical protein
VQGPIDQTSQPPPDSDARGDTQSCDLLRRRQATNGASAIGYGTFVLYDTAQNGVAYPTTGGGMTDMNANRACDRLRDLRVAKPGTPQSPGSDEPRLARRVSIRGSRHDEDPVRVRSRSAHTINIDLRTFGQQS